MGLAEGSGIADGVVAGTGAGIGVACGVGLSNGVGPGDGLFETDGSRARATDARGTGVPSWAQLAIVNETMIKIDL